MDWLTSHLEVELFHLGETAVTPLSLLILGITLVVTFMLANGARSLLTRVLTRGAQTNEGIAYAVGRIAQYTVIVAGVLLALENIGVSITAFAAVGAFLSVGIGFGLQNITQNFISGLILLVERPVQPGDVIELENGTVGRVTEIEMRATRLVTLDGISVLVPNSGFVSGQVRNLHAPERANRLRIAVGVAYGSDVSLVRRVLLEVAKKDQRVLAKPAPDVLFQDFGDSALAFELAVWLEDAELRPKVGSDLRFAIDAAFRRHDISIPFPQRDVHLVDRTPDPG